MSQTIGFIGLGSMGQPMAANLLKAGYSVSVTYHSRKEPAEQLQALGATIVNSVSELAQRCDTIITILPADREIMQVYAGDGGLLDHLQPGSVCIDMTSAKGQTMQDVAALAGPKGVRLLDAPVSGGVAGAVEGTLTIMVGGDADLLETCRPILEAMGKKIFYTGEVGSAKSVKMINQLLNAGNTYVAAEAIYLAKQLGVDTTLLSNVVNESSGASFVFKNAVAQAIIPENFEKGFKLDLMKKDVGLSMEQADQLGIQLPVLRDVYQIFQAISEQGKGDKHYGIISEWVKQVNEAE